MASKFKKIFFIGCCLLMSTLPVLSQQNRTEKEDVSNKLPSYLQNISWLDSSTIKNYSSQLKFKKGNLSYASSQRANFLFKETPLLKSIHPNYNYLGGNMDFESNRIPSPKEIQPR